MAVTEEEAVTAVDTCGGEGGKGQWEARAEMMSKYIKAGQTVKILERTVHHALQILANGHLHLAWTYKQPGRSSMLFFQA